jgi:hypothetical protein
MKGISLMTILALLGIGSVIGTFVVGTFFPKILPEPLRTFFFSLRVLAELLGVSWIFPELREIGLIIFLPLFIALLYIFLRLIRGGG